MQNLEVGTETLMGRGGLKNLVPEIDYLVTLDHSVFYILLTYNKLCKIRVNRKDEIGERKEWAERKRGE